MSSILKDAAPYMAAAVLAAYILYEQTQPVKKNDNDNNDDNPTSLKRKTAAQVLTDTAVTVAAEAAAEAVATTILNTMDEKIWRAKTPAGQTVATAEEPKKPYARRHLKGQGVDGPKTIQVVKEPVIETPDSIAMFEAFAGNPRVQQAGLEVASDAYSYFMGK
jgi:hypothetical protein